MDLLAQPSGDGVRLPAAFLRYVEDCPLERWEGRVSRVAGHLLESDGPFCSVGECCEIVEVAGRSLGRDCRISRSDDSLDVPGTSEAGFVMATAS